MDTGPKKVRINSDAVPTIHSTATTHSTASVQEADHLDQPRPGPSTPVTPVASQRLRTLMMLSPSEDVTSQCSPPKKIRRGYAKRETTREKEFNIEPGTFNASAGWCSRFMDRNDLSLRQRRQDAVKKKVITAICRTLSEEIEEQDALSLKDDETKDSDSTNSAHSDQDEGGKSDASFSVMNKDETPCIALPSHAQNAVKKKAITTICRTLRHEIEGQDALSLKDDETKDSDSTNSAHSEQDEDRKSDASFSVMDKDEKPCIIPPDMIKIEKPVENQGFGRGRKVCIDDCHDSPVVNVPTMISEDLDKANKEIIALKLKIDVMKKLVSYQKKWSVKWIQDNDEKTCMYTGLPSWLAFLNLYTIVEPVVTEAKCELPDSDGTDTGGDLTLCDELFAVLIKLKLGLFSEDVARCFSIPVKRFKKIFEIWISSLFLKFANWSSMRADCKKQMDYVIPSFIRKNFDVKIILCWLPLEFSAASADDQNNEKFKMLTGLDRHGKIIFLSGMWIQQSNRLTVAENSAVLNLIKDGDTIVVPSDLEIVSALTISSKNVKVVVLPYNTKEMVGTTADQMESIHNFIQWSLDRVKWFGVMDKVVQVENQEHADKIVAVCCQLSNIYYS
ncbi:hypothetical protein ScPMuIL_011381 [Solemya velum]